MYRGSNLHYIYLGRPSWQQIQMAKSLLYWGATLRKPTSPMQLRSAADGKVLQLSPSLQPSPQIQDPSHATTAANNRRNWPRRSNEDPQEVEWDQSSYVVPDGRLQRETLVTGFTSLVFWKRNFNLLVTIVEWCSSTSDSLFIILELHRLCCSTSRRRRACQRIQ